MDLTEEQYDLVFAYLGVQNDYRGGGLCACGGPKEGTPELSEEEQIFLAQYEEDLS